LLDKILKKSLPGEFSMSDYTKKFNSFVDIVKQLCSENGCPWDRKQTPATLQRYIREEANELLEAIAANDAQHIKEESGDLLYLIILLAQIHNDEGLFDIGDVLDAISTKMIRRHPHVFGDEKIDTVTELRQRWLEIKCSEKSNQVSKKKN